MNKPRSYYRRRKRTNSDQNDGKPGVVYILRNDAFKETWLKIGQSTQSVQARARRVNEDAGTGIPKHHVCVFEQSTADCGRAEKAVHLRLAEYRKGSQDYFECDLELAKRIVVEECHKMDAAASATFVAEEAERAKAQAEREAQDRQEKIQREGEGQPAAQALAEAQRQRLQREHEDDSLRVAAEIARAVAQERAFEEAQQARAQRIEAAAVDGANRRNGGPGPLHHVRRKGLGIFYAGLLVFMVVVVGLTYTSSNNTGGPSSVQARPSPATLTESNTVVQDRRKRALATAVADAVRQFPYLATKDGDLVVKLIVADRDRRIASGAEPADALRKAVALLARKYEPRLPRPLSRKVTPPDEAGTGVPPEVMTMSGLDRPAPAVPVPMKGADDPTPPIAQEAPPFDAGNHPGFDPKCRWLTRYEWSCK